LKDKKYGYMDVKGNVIIEAKFSALAEYDSVPDIVGRFYGDGYCIVREGKKFGVIDKKGNYILPAQYDGISGYTYSTSSTSSTQK